MSASRESSKRSYRYFTPIAMIFVAVLIISNIAAQKLFAFGPFTFSCGIILFPISYIFGDVLTECYGYAKTRQIIWVGLLCNLLLIITLQISISLPPAPGWPFQEQFATALGLVPRVVLASVLAYWMGEFSNSFLLSKMKIITKGKHLWTRTISSTIVGEGVDTIVFALIAFYNIIPTNVLVSAIISGYIFKVLYEIVATPFTYVIVNFIKRREGIDVFDHNANYNPFDFSAGPE
jgi:uncharacterized integral membrane protein (TIGR00697 family)